MECLYDAWAKMVADTSMDSCRETVIVPKEGDNNEHVFGAQSMHSDYLWLHGSLYMLFAPRTSMFRMRLINDVRHSNGQRITA